MSDIIKMHTEEVHTSRSLVRRLIAAQFPDWIDLPIQPLRSSGTDNAMYRLGSDMVVRLPRIHWAVSAVEREHQWLPLLAPLLPVAIPTPLAKGVPGEGYPYPWSIYQWIDGANPLVDHIADPDLLASDLAAFIKALHQLKLQGGPPAGRSGSLTMRDEAVRLAIKQLASMINSQAVTAVWEMTLNGPDWDNVAVWLHSDLAPGNLLLVNDRLRAVIDFSGVGMGDPACDLAVGWNLLSAQSRRVFRSMLNIDDATWARGRGWALSIALIQLPYYQYTNPALAGNARYVIHEVLLEAV